MPSTTSMIITTITQGVSIAGFGNGGDSYVLLSLSFGSLSKAVVVGVVAGVLHVHVSLTFGEDIPPYISKHFLKCFPSEAWYVELHNVKVILQGALKLSCTPFALNSGQLPLIGLSS